MLRSALAAFARRRVVRSAVVARRAMSTAAADASAAASAGASAGAAAKPTDWKGVGRKVAYALGGLAVFDALTYVNYTYTVPRRLYRNALESVVHDERVLARLGRGAKVVSKQQFLVPFDRKNGQVAYTCTLEGTKRVGVDPANPKSSKGTPARATLMVQLDQSSGAWAPRLVRFAAHDADGTDGQAIDLTEAAAASFERRMAADPNRSIGELVWGATPPKPHKSRAHARAAADH